MIVFGVVYIFGALLTYWAGFGVLQSAYRNNDHDIQFGYALKRLSFWWPIWLITVLPWNLFKLWRACLAEQRAKVNAFQERQLREAELLAERALKSSN